MNEIFNLVMRINAETEHVAFLNIDGNVEWFTVQIAPDKENYLDEIYYKNFVDFDSEDIPQIIDDLQRFLGAVNHA